ncbi:MAG: dihydrodipicolinate reductase C-terminal domain-containing protein [bacterium]
MIGVIGISGKIGNFVANLLKEENSIIGYDKNNSNEFITYDNYTDFFNNDLDLVIDFSNSNLSKDILLECIRRNIKVLSGTSNIPNLKEISDFAYGKKVSFVYLENYSKGINQLISIIDKISCDKKEIIEEHYHKKTDISQTAISIAKKLDIDNISSVRTLKRESNHYIKFYFEDEEIEIIHKCFSPYAYKDVLIKEINKIKNSDFYYKCGIIDVSKK